MTAVATDTTRAYAHSMSHFLRASTEKAEALLNQVEAELGNASDALDSVQVVTATVLAKRVAKVAASIEGTLKDLLKGRHQPKDEQGRVQNVKVQLDGENGMKVELRPKVTVKFNADRAGKALKQKGLYDEASVTQQVITDPKALASAVELAMTALTKAGDATTARELAGALATATTTETSLSEDRIADLVQGGKLTLEEVEAFFDRKTDHSLYDITK